ncbi:hypothetical protein KIN20_001569 [Parelaphostrongylus tenuis]|uniref:Uncharacterized protein n=1 Tax=Parelaphostrongylus tenuis TaxID=148309 RepID=A0AAD5LU94_PARTN|nr:hypothetical protein KIN20_001569 [Parelaphostrongylus tenuis]
MAQSGGNTIAEIYKGVIQDVISQVKEAFLDENVDIDVLSQLKKEWEDKVIASGCVDMEPRHQVVPPPMRPHVMQPRMGTVTQVTQVRLQPAPQMVAQSHPTVVNHIEQGRPLQMQYVPQQGMQQIQVQQVQHATVPSGVAFTPQGSVRMVQAIQSQPGQQYVIAQSGQQLQPGVMFLQQANGQHIPVTVGPNGVIQHRIQQAHGGHQLHQLDGNGCLIEDNEDSVDSPCSSRLPVQKQHSLVSKKKKRRT